MSAASSTTAATALQPLGQFVASLAAKQATPGGGAAAAVGASVGAAAASMAAAFTQRKKDHESGAAAAALSLQNTLDASRFLTTADEDAVAYAALQTTWKDPDMDAATKQAIEARALQVPTELLESCHTSILAICDFLPLCNPNITSDAKVGLHQLAGAARAAYQTVLVNAPPQEENKRLQQLLKEIRAVEDKMLGLDDE